MNRAVKPSRKKVRKAPTPEIPETVDDAAPSEALLEAERDIGIADWIDVETGEPAEGQSPPHLQED